MKHLIVCLILLLGSQGCISTAPSEKTGEPSAYQPAIDNRQSEPTVQPGIGLHITVLAGNNKEFDENPVRVNRQGQIALPLLGGVDVSGRSLSEIEDQLEDRYAKYFVDADVIASFIHDSQAPSPWGYVTVLGRVEDPGRIPLPASRDLTVSAAVQRAGGLASSAKSSAIRVTRQNTNGTPQHFETDLKAFANGDMDEDRNLKAGDVVYVPERIW